MTFPERSARLPALARVAVRLTTPPDRRASVEGDLAELLEARRAMGRRDLRRALARDVLSLIWASIRRHARRGQGRWTGVVTDARLAGRLFSRQSGFAALATGTLALGIASATAVFSIGDRVLLRPLPYPEPQRIFAIDDPPLAVAARTGRLILSRRVRELPELVGAGTYVVGGLNLGGGAAALRVSAASVSPGFFAAMGVMPFYGRTLSEEDDAANARVVVVSHGLWRGRLGAPKDIFGTSLQLNGNEFVVAGVMPPGFAFPAGVDAWILSAADRQMAGQASAPAAIARTAPGVSPAQAQAALDRINDLQRERNPDARPARLRPLREQLTGAVRPMLLFLTAAVSLLLCVTCANVAGVALSRLASRHQELVLRRALGASPLRLVRLVAIETAGLTVAGAAIGVPASFWLTRAFVALSPVALPEYDFATVDWRMAVVGIAITAACTILVAVAPALATLRADAAAALRAGATSTGRSTWWRSALVTGQIATAVVLIAAALATWSTFRTLLLVDPGIRPISTAHVAELMLPLVRYPTPSAVSRFYDELEPRLKSAGVAQVAAASYYPGSPAMGVGFRLDATDRPAPAGSPPLFSTRVSVSERYFDVMGMPLLRGRAFTSSDRAGAPNVAVLSLYASRALWPDEVDPIGRRITVRAGSSSPGTFEVIGIVGDARFSGPRFAARGAIYVPFSQHGAFGGFSLIVDAGPRAGSIGDVLREALRGVDADVPPYDIRPMSAALTRFLARERLALVVCALFAGVTVVLVTIGLYGVLAQAVAQRTREMALRLALGADAVRLQWTVVKDAQRLVVPGVALGLLGSWLMATGLRRLAPDLMAPSIGAFALPIVVLLAAGLLAAWLPARRAAAIDPMKALRSL